MNIAQFIFYLIFKDFLKIFMIIFLYSYFLFHYRHYLQSGVSAVAIGGEKGCPIIEALVRRLMDFYTCGRTESGKRKYQTACVVKVYENIHNIVHAAPQLLRHTNLRLTPINKIVLNNWLVIQILKIIILWPDVSL